MSYNPFWQNTQHEKHKPKRPEMVGRAESIAAQNRAGQAEKYGAAQGTLGQFEGRTQDSPYYKSLLATSTDATSNAYENAKAASAARARQAGFGYGTPIGQAASREPEGAEAAALARLPAEAMQQTVPVQLEAAKQTAGMGSELGREGEEYFTRGAVPLEEGYQQRRASFINNLINTGVGAATGFIPRPPGAR